MKWFGVDVPVADTRLGDSEAAMTRLGDSEVEDARLGDSEVLALDDSLLGDLIPEMTLHVGSALPSMTDL